MLVDIEGFRGRKFERVTNPLISTKLRGQRSQLLGLSRTLLSRIVGHELDHPGVFDSDPLYRRLAEIAKLGLLKVEEHLEEAIEADDRGNGALLGDKLGSLADLIAQSVYLDEDFVTRLALEKIKAIPTLAR